MSKQNNKDKDKDKDKVVVVAVSPKMQATKQNWKDDRACECGSGIHWLQCNNNSDWGYCG